MRGRSTSGFGSTGWLAFLTLAVAAAPAPDDPTPSQWAPVEGGQNNPPVAMLPDPGVGKPSPRYLVGSVELAPPKAVKSGTLTLVVEYTVAANQLAKPVATVTVKNVRVDPASPFVRFSLGELYPVLNPRIRYTLRVELDTNGNGVLDAGDYYLGAHPVFLPDTKLVELPDPHGPKYVEMLTLQARPVVNPDLRQRP